MAAKSSDQYYYDVAMNRQLKELNLSSKVWPIYIELSRWG